MRREYVITFHTNYEALVCKRKLESMNEEGMGGVNHKLIPVPRELSSGCGTALKVSAEKELELSFFDDIEYDGLFSSFSDGTYSLLKEGV